MSEKFQRGKHVNYVGGAGEDAVVAHFLGHNDDGTDSIQVPSGGVERVPRREPAHGTYTPTTDSSDPKFEDLGRTWHTIRGDDSPRPA